MTTAHSKIAPGNPIRRSEIIERAESWLRPSVPYSQSRFHQNEYGIYRTDCSGYVSMAWGLPGIPPNRHGGLNTVDLAQVSIEIDQADLLAGDILLRTEGTQLTRHVTIFHEWVDSTRTCYRGFEQRGGIGTTYRQIPYPYDDFSSLYSPRRHVRIITGS
jgi:hypothetical protein